MGRPPTGVFVISLDFELHWGVRDHVGRDTFRRSAAGTRAAVRRMLERFEVHSVAATWATVGCLMADDAETLRAWWPERSPGYRVRGLDAQDELERGIDAALHIAPELVERIIAAPEQELATHSFSHFYCGEDGVSPASFRADLEAAKKAAARWDVELQSIVFPRNQVAPAMLQVCADAGLRYYRGQPEHVLYRPRKSDAQSLPVRAGRLLDAVVPLTGVGRQRCADHRPSLMINVPASRFFRPNILRSQTLSTLGLRRVLAEMRDAAKVGALFHLWWHPHNFAAGDFAAGDFAAGDRAFESLEVVLQHFAYLRSRFGMRSATMASAGHDYRAARVAS